MAASTGFKKLTAIETWVNDIAKVGKRIGSQEQWHAFASTVVSQLPRAYTDGWRAQNTSAQRRELLKPLQQLAQAIAHAEDAIDHDPIFCRRFGLTPETYQLASESFLGYITRIIVDLHPSRRSDNPRPGRQSRTAIEITGMLALEYYRHFGKLPGRSRDSKKKTPFTHVCAIVERILESMGHAEVSLGYEARREGIEHAALMALRDLYQLGPEEQLFVSDPRQALKREEERRRTSTSVENEKESLRRRTPVSEFELERITAPSTVKLVRRAGEKALKRKRAHLSVVGR
jgi:hypothetical protein